MDKKALSEIEERLLEVNKIVGKLDVSIRVAAFDFLKPYITTGAFIPDTAPKKPAADPPSSADESELIQKHGDGKPNDNVNLIAALWFGEYGSNPFSIDHVREKARSAGLTIPARTDMTLRSAREKGKSLYLSTGRGLFKPTVVGEAFLKVTYNVKRGTKTPSTEQ